MLLYLLPLVVLGVVLVLLCTAVVALLRSLRSVIRIRERSFSVSSDVIRPGDRFTVQAKVVPRGHAKLAVRATLACMMFDHRARPLYTSAVLLAPVSGQPHTHAASVRMPEYAIRTGVAGDELSSLFSEDAHRVLVFWSVNFDVLSAQDPGTVILRASIPLEIPEGKPLRADRAYMEQLIIETCRTMHSDLVLNWMVRLAAANGVIAQVEREFLHQVLGASHGITDPATADARIHRETQQDLGVDALVLRKHLAPELRVDLYRFLYAMAWRDGALDGREHEFLVHALEQLGLGRRGVFRIEGEVLRESAQAQLR